MFVDTNKNRRIFIFRALCKCINYTVSCLLLCVGLEWSHGSVLRLAVDTLPKLCWFAVTWLNESAYDT